MSNKNSCSGCMNAISNKEYLQCSTCNQRYDLLCSNVTEKRFKSMKVSDKATWKCQDCRSKLPKTNNNDTPVRTTRTETCKESASRKNSISPSESNVTMRSKLPRSLPASPLVDEIVSSANTSNSNPESQYNKRFQSTPATSIDDETVLETTKSSLREIIRQEIASALKQTVAEQFKQFSELISGFRASLDFYNEKYEDMKIELEQNSSKVQVLERENIMLQKSMQDLTKRLNILDQHSRANNIEIQNVPENRSENLISTVLQLSKITKCQIQESDIAHCTRIAKKDTQASRPRSILVKLNTPRLRDTFLAASINFNKNNINNKLNTSHLGIAAENPIPIYVVEHLSADNKALHAATRLRGKELGYKYVWVRNGRIFMRKDDISERIVVTSQEFLKSVT